MSGPATGRAPETERRLTLYPAIDIRDGRAVRLLRGDYERETAYESDPRRAAERWLREGAEILHVVDLDGARAGRPRWLELVGEIAAASAAPIQLGGGLRDRDAVAAAFEAGAARAVLGTKAQRDPDLIGELVAEHGAERVVASVDGRAGKVAIEGWEQPTDTPIAELAARLVELGARRFVYTPVEVDGTLAGPGLDDLAAIADVCADAGAELIYSGGIGSLADLRSLRALEHPAIGGVIVGRALYEGRFSVAEAIEALSSEPRSGAGE